MPNHEITSVDMIEDLVKNEGLSDYMRKQIERIRTVAFNEGRLMEFRLYNNINRNIDNNE